MSAEEAVVGDLVEGLVVQLSIVAGHIVVSISLVAAKHIAVALVSWLEG